MITVTITLDDALEDFVRRFAASRGLSAADGVVELIRRNAQVEEMNTLRHKMLPYYQQTGVDTEEDVSRLVNEIRDKQIAI